MAIDLGAIKAQLNEAVPGAIVDQEGEWLVLAADRLTAAAAHLRDKMGFDYLTHVSASDYADRFEVVYTLYSTRPELQGPGLSLKVRLPDKADAHLSSVTPIWGSANFQEREVWDMFGIRFDGHPNLKRILLWEGFPGHPLRKDFENRTYTFEELKPTRPTGAEW